MIIKAKSGSNNKIVSDNNKWGKCKTKTRHGRLRWEMTVHDSDYKYCENVHGLMFVENGSHERASFYILPLVRDNRKSSTLVGTQVATFKCLIARGVGIGGGLETIEEINKWRG